MTEVAPATLRIRQRKAFKPGSTNLYGDLSLKNREGSPRWFITRAQLAACDAMMGRILAELSGSV